MGKIFVVTTVHPGDDARIYYREILSLAKKYQVVFLAPSKPTNPPKNIEVITFPESDRFGRGLAYFKYLRQQKAAVVHFHDLDFGPWAILYKFIAGAAIIFDKHEFVPLTVENRSWAPDILKPLIKLLFELADIFVSAFSSHLIVANPRQLERDRGATLLLNAPPLSSFPSPNLKKNYKELCYIGDITKARGAENLLALANFLPAGFKIKLLGVIRNEELEKDFLSQKNIDVLGFVASDKIHTVLESVGIGLIPFEDRTQYHFSIPSKAFDYLALGMQIVMPRFVEEAFGPSPIKLKGVKLTDGTPRDLLKKVESIGRAKDNLMVAAECREAFESRYNWSSEEKKLLSLYKQIFQGEARG